MLTKYLSSILFILFMIHGVFAQQQTSEYARVKISLLETDISEVARLGLETDHGELAKGRHLINDYSYAEIELLKVNEIPFEILIKDVKAYYKAQNIEGHHHFHGNHHHPHPHNYSKNPSPCDGTDTDNAYDYETPTNYTEGSMGGYFTYAEMLDILDDMRTKYPNLISERTPIEGALTHEGRPIYWLRISNNPDIDEEKPEVLYTALHHAREPNSLSQMIFYLWYVLENYDTDPDIKYIVDHTEMYFVPCINPDGYLYNEATNPEGGGLWRKNRWADETGEVFGVDLNRNYGFEWAHDDQGSSSSPSSQVYRGQSGFSEPETQAIRDFCNAHQFKICMNYHSYGNLLIYPWGYSDEPTEEAESFNGFAQLMTAENNYFAGTGTETVGYVVNGNSDDWMYGETETKPSIFAMTPEVGDFDFGFWPPQSAIDRLNKSALRQNIVTALLPQNYGELEDNSGNNLFAQSGTLPFNFKKFGLADGMITIAFAGISDNVEVLTAPIQTDLAHLGQQSIDIDYQVLTDVSDEIVFEATLSNGIYTWTQTFTKNYSTGAFETVFSDESSDEMMWIDSDWAVTVNDFVSAPFSWTDSPNGDYDRDLFSTHTVAAPIDLTNATTAITRFYAKWDIEANYDYVQFQVSTDGINFESQCGKYTKAGSGNQDEGEPLYDGTQAEWVLEEVNLDTYLGEEIYVRFLLVSDGYVEGDGFYFDDLVVEAVLDEDTAVQQLDENVLQQFKATPNPFTEQVMLDFILQTPIHRLDISVTNALGQTIFVEQRTNLNAVRQQLTLNTQNWESGLYMVRFQTGTGAFFTQKIMKVE